MFDPIVEFIEKSRDTLPFLKVSRTFAVILLLTGITLASYEFLTYAIPKTTNGIQQLRNKLKQYHIDIREYIENKRNNSVGYFLDRDQGNDNTTQNQSNKYANVWELVDEDEAKNIDTNKTILTNKSDTEAGKDN